MPLVSSDYRPPLYLRSGHLSTIYSGLFRKVTDLVQHRERLELPDGDFMDLDWSFAEKSSVIEALSRREVVNRSQLEGAAQSLPKTPDTSTVISDRSLDEVGKSLPKKAYKASKRVVILLHGLEGNAQRPYITGSARAFNQAGIDACAVNFRGCSGETNRLYRSYHSGATEDLDAVVKHILREKNYDEIYIKGISLGGNMTMKYVGEDREIAPEIKAVIGVSVPCSLYGSLKQLLSRENIPYAIRFKKHLIDKLRLKLPLFPEKISSEDIRRIKNLKDFDDIYTAPAHGFKDALDYYEKCSCRQFLPNIKVPSLIINARNDSFLDANCYPVPEAENHKWLHLETPHFGGHVGFISSGNHYYSEKRAIKFINETR